MYARESSDWVLVKWARGSAAAGLALEELVEELLRQLRLDHFILDADIGVVLVDEGLLDRAILRRHSSIICR